MGVMDVQGLGLRIQNLQTDYTKNEQRVESATDAALKAKIKANNANTELYQLNNDYKNVSGSLEEKTRTIGGAKDLAIDLQKRANDLAGQASNKLNYLSDVETELEENETKLTKLQAELVQLSCEMLIHLRVIEYKSNFYRTCNPQIRGHRRKLAHVTKGPWNQLAYKPP